MTQLPLTYEPAIARTRRFVADAPALPPHARASRTSRAAAVAVKSRTRRDEERLLAWLIERGADGATDHEIAHHFGWIGDYTRPRRWRLSHRLGLVIDSGRERAFPGHKAGAVWVAKRG